MVDTINTNGSAFAALSTLSNSRTKTATTQNQITSGLRVSSPRDNAATFAIAQNLLAEQSGRAAVTQSLNRAQSTTDVALAAGSQVFDLLLRARELTTQALDPGLDDTSRQALNTEFQSVRDQIGSVVSSANFNGTNVLESGGGNISAITNEDGSSTFSLANQNLSLGGSNVTLDLNADISSLDGARQTFEQIETSSKNVNSSLAQLGSGANNLADLEEFSQTLSDVTEAGIGDLIDANLAESAADQAAGQVREQLGLVALNIANQQPQNILQLFEE